MLHFENETPLHAYASGTWEHHNQRGCELTYKILVYWKILNEQEEKIRAVAERYDCEAIFTVDPETAKKEAKDADILFGSSAGPLREAEDLKWFCSSWAGVNGYLEDELLPIGRGFPGCDANGTCAGEQPTSLSKTSTAESSYYRSDDIELYQREKCGDVL